MRGRYKFIQIISWILFAIALSEVLTYIYFAVNDLLSDENHLLEVIFAFITPGVLIIWALCFFLFIAWRIKLKNLRIENEHFLGMQDCYFYNLDFFKRYLKRLPFKKSNESYYILAFTPCGGGLSNSISRNSIIVKFNGLISEMITTYFKNNTQAFSKGKFSFCYNRGIFNVFVVADQAKIDALLKDLEYHIYQVAKENEIRIFVQPFFGVAKFNKSDDISIVSENAALARHHAERNFELSFYYDPSIRNENLLNEAKEIADGIVAKEFVVYYQPKFSLNSKSFISSEALVRWNSSKYGFLNPGQFIEKVEKSGMIHEIDMFVFNRVCEDLNEAKRRGRRMLPVSINFSLYEFFSPNFVEDIVSIIDKNNIDHSLIEIEITETTTQSNPFLAVSIMKQIKKQGLRVLMDDFGVGYSNFTNLRKMPIDALKIDKSFVDQIINDKKSREIMRFLISLGKSIDLEVIAEGVDNKEQVELLTRAKLDTIQGYYYSKPLPFKEYSEFLRNNTFEKREKIGGLN